MADGNQLAQAYSILGQATTAEYKRRRKEEEEREKRMMRNQILGYLAQPLLKTAGEAIAGGVTELIRSPTEKKYEEFLQSEEFLAKKSKQDSYYTKAQAVILDDNKANMNAAGREAYYADRRYEELLKSFKAQYPEEDYDEGAEGVLRNQADTWARENISKIDDQVALSRRIRSGKDLETMYAEGLKPRSLGQIIADGTKKLFTGKDNQQMREDRLDFLAKKNNISGEALLESQRALGMERNISEIAGLAKKLDDYRYTQEAWRVVSAEPVIDTVYSGGKSFTVEYTKETKKHPERQETVTKLVPKDERSREFLEKGMLGTIEEIVEDKDFLGRTRETVITKKYTTSGVEVVEVLEQELGPISAVRAAEQMTPQQGSLANAAIFEVSRNLESKFGGSVADANLTQDFMAQTSGSPEDTKNMLSSRVFGLGATLRTYGIDMTDKNAYNLAAAMVLRQQDSEAQGTRGFLGPLGGGARVFNPEISNGLSSAENNEALSVHMLDAIYALENSNSPILKLSKPQEDALIEDSFRSFAELGFNARESLLTSMKPFPQVSNRKYKGSDFTLYELYMKAHMDLGK